MMYFKYCNKFSNNSKNINNFYDVNNFIGYILPNGEIYKVKEHNIESIESILKMNLELLKNSYADKNIFLDKDSSNPIIKLILNYLNNKSYDEIMALKEFIDKYNLDISSILVELFKCHIITRLNKQIITSLGNHECFYNYLLHDYTIYTIDSIFYNNIDKKYCFIKERDENISLLQEINEIKKDVNKEDIELFMKK